MYHEVAVDSCQPYRCIFFRNVYSQPAPSHPPRVHTSPLKLSPIHLPIWSLFSSLSFIFPRIADFSIELSLSIRCLKYSYLCLKLEIWVDIFDDPFFSLNFSSVFSSKSIITVSFLLPFFFHGVSQGKPLPGHF